MEITVHQGAILQEAAQLVALPVWEDEPLSAEVAELIEAGDFKARAKQTLLLYPRGALAAKRLLLLGLGKRDTAIPETIRQAGALAAQKARELQVAALAIALPLAEPIAPAEAAQALAEGAELGLYRFLEYKSEPAPEQTFQVERLRVVVAGDMAAVQRGVSAGQAIARGAALARDLANAPGNAVTPARLGEVAQELGGRLGFAVTVLDRAALAEQGFGGILAVGQGSANEPRFIVIEYGKAGDGPTICLVGKGITFDTGGISIKPAEKMDEMKMDMGGAAAVLGAMQVVGELKPALHIVGLIASAENMPGATAYKPGDIIKTLSGKTVEVLNTDAEGRIVLADALCYAQRYQPAAIVDLATLTGAILVALGSHAIGMMSNNQELADRLLRAGVATHERVWQLPLWDEYRDAMKSEIADLKNTGGRFGGAITAAGFLAAFVGEYPWAHLDIAGTAWTESATRAYYGKGATGIGVRLLTQLLRDYAQ